MEHGFNWLADAAGLSHYPNHVMMAAIVALGLAICGLLVKAKLQSVMSRPGGGVVPESKLSFLNFFEIVAEKLYALTESVLGHHLAPRYFPLIGTLFLFILTCNLVGLIPGVLPPTDNLNTTLAIGAFVFIYYNFEGLRSNGWGYLKHFLGPVLWLAPLMVLIEFISHLVRPISLGLRLRGNIMGDHLVLSIFHSFPGPYIYPVIFYGVGVFVCFIQAFVFCLMTMVYLSMSTAHDH